MRSFVAICLAATALSIAAGAEDKHCQLQSYGELPATIESGAIVTEGQVNGQTVRLILDTGATITQMFRDQAEKLGLAFREVPGATSYGVGGQSKVYSVRIKEFRLGNLVEHNADIIASGHGIGGAQGLIGEKFLSQTDLELDLAHGKIRFFKPHDCVGDQVVYWGEAYAVAPLIATPQDEILAKVAVSGTPMIAQLDTGSSTSVLTPNAAAQVGVSRQTSGVKAEGQALGSGGVVPVWVGVFPSFSFGEETIKNARLRISDLFGSFKEKQLGDMIATPIEDEPQMLLGADFVRSHRIYIAFSQHKIYASYQGGPVFDTREPAAEAAKP